MLADKLSVKLLKFLIFLILLTSCSGIPKLKEAESFSEGKLGSDEMSLIEDEMDLSRDVASSDEDDEDEDEYEYEDEDDKEEEKEKNEDEKEVEEKKQQDQSSESEEESSDDGKGLEDLELSDIEAEFKEEIVEGFEEFKKPDANFKIKSKRKKKYSAFKKPVKKRRAASRGIASYFNNPPKIGVSSLLGAAKKATPETIRVLVEKKGIDVNSQSKITGKTALIIAVQAKRRDNVRSLLKLNADPYLTDNKGKSAHDYARENNLSDILP